MIKRAQYKLPLARVPSGPAQQQRWQKSRIICQRTGIGDDFERARRAARGKEVSRHSRFPGLIPRARRETIILYCWTIVLSHMLDHPSVQLARHMRIEWEDGQARPGCRQELDDSRRCLPGGNTDYGHSCSKSGCLQQGCSIYLSATVQLSPT